MEHPNTTQPPAPVQVKALALELGVPVEEVERELTPKNIFSSASGFRSCTSFSANRLVEKYAARKAEAEAEAKRASEEAKARRETQRAAAIAARANTESRVQQFGLQTVVINPNADGILPVAKMTANADLDFVGGTPTRRPSRLDWLTGKNLEGGTFGPAPKRNKKGKDPK